MSSYTSSSRRAFEGSSGARPAERRFQFEARALLFVALALAASEAGMRVAANRLSLDMQHIAGIPEVAEAVRRDPSRTVLFLGNSLTRRGVDLRVIGPALGKCVRAYAVYPDDTTILDWHYTLERFFVDAGAAPSVVVVGYASFHLDDSAPYHPERIAQYAGLRYAGELFANDLRGADARANYLLSSVSMAFAEGGRLKLMIFDHLIPAYRATAQWLNSAALGEMERNTGSSLERLKRFLALCRAAGIAPVFVAMPVPGSYPLDPRIPATVAAGGGRFIDLRQTPGIDDKCYLDGHHLNPRGAVLYSTALAPRLNAALREIFAVGQAPSLRPAPQAGHNTNESFGRAESPACAAQAKGLPTIPAARGRTPRPHPALRWQAPS
jgi:hypothetical protein